MLIQLSRKSFQTQTKHPPPTYLNHGRWIWKALVTSLKGGKAPPRALSSQWNEGHKAPGRSTLKASKRAPKPPFESQKFPFTSSSFSNEISSFSGTGLKQQSSANHSLPISYSVLYWIRKENGIWSQKASIRVLWTHSSYGTLKKFPGLVWLDFLNRWQYYCVLPNTTYPVSWWSLCTLKNSL